MLFVAWITTISQLMYVVSLVIGYLSYASSVHEKAEILLKLLCFGREKSFSHLPCGMEVKAMF